jgi:hypothetical protein
VSINGGLAPPEKTHPFIARIFQKTIPLLGYPLFIPSFQWEFQDPTDGGTVPSKAIFCGDIPLHRLYIGLIYGRYLQFRFLKWPFIVQP